MNDRQRAPIIAGFLSLVAASGCPSQATPPGGAQAPTDAAPVNVNAPPPAASAALPLLTPSGVVSVAAPPASAAPPTPAGPRSSPDGKMCGGIAGFRCPEKQYCAFGSDAHCGAGDMAGTCQPIPELCTLDYAPVCGCDGKVYSNACAAGRSGVSVAAKGTCTADGKPAPAIADGKACGTRGVAGDCAKGSYCAYTLQCGATDAGGKCAKKPELCPHLVAPVCGCDSKTYNNGCEAAREGVSVAAQGACKL